MVDGGEVLPSPTSIRILAPVPTPMPGIEVRTAKRGWVSSSSSIRAACRLRRSRTTVSDAVPGTEAAALNVPSLAAARGVRVRCGAGLAERHLAGRCDGGGEVFALTDVQAEEDVGRGRRSASSAAAGGRPGSSCPATAGGRAPMGGRLVDHHQHRSVLGLELGEHMNNKADQLRQRWVTGVLGGLVLPLWPCRAPAASATTSGGSWNGPVPTCRGSAPSGAAVRRAGR